MESPIRVLHVDDEPSFADLVETFLEREDDRIDVRTAASASEGLAVVDEDDVDCVVSDYDMPGENGIDFLETVRETHPDLPFILYTGKGSEEIASEAISAGVTDYLQKESGTDQYAVLANRIENAVGHRRSQEALAERNRELRRYERMVNSMREAACVYDADGRFEIVNEYLAEWYNTTRESLEGTESSLVEHVRESGDGDAYRELLDGERDQIQGEVETEFPGHGNAVVAYQLTPLRVDGSIRGVVGVARDVTERRKRDRELKRRTRAMDAAPFGITITDPAAADNPVIYANRAFRELTGYEEAEILGRNCRLLQGEATDPESVAALRDAVEAGEATTVELLNYRKDGTDFYNRVTIAPVTDDDGTVRNWVGFQEDVTERRDREQRLSFFERVVETTGAAIAVYDETGSFVYVNEAYAALLGVDRRSLDGAKVWDVNPEFDRERFDGYWDSFSEGETRTTETRHAWDGDPIPVKTITTRQEIQDDVYHFGTIVDLSERQAYEEELEERNERLEAFAGIVSHDLRNPLNVAESRLDLVREECDSKHLDGVERAHDRMETLIGDLLTLARQEESTIARTTVGLEQIATQCWETVATPTATLVVESDLTVRADEGQLGQLFENLFRNAVEHGGEDVTITVGSLDGRSGFFVEDDGPGIPENDREKIFETGYTTTDEGTGFGLAIVERVVDAHGWEIDATESEGGARFEITGITDADD